MAQGQIVLQNIADVQAIAREVEALLPKLKEVAQQAYPSIVKRGGGVVKLATRTFNSEAFLCGCLDGHQRSYGCQYVKYGIGSNGH